MDQEMLLPGMKNVPPAQQMADSGYMQWIAFICA